MNTLQRAIIGYYVFAIGLGVVGAVAKDQSIMYGIVLGHGLYLFLAIVVIAVVWMVEGADILDRVR